jgi:hypothetical protein
MATPTNKDSRTQPLALSPWWTGQCRDGSRSCRRRRHLRHYLTFVPQEFGISYCDERVGGTPAGQPRSKVLEWLGAKSMRTAAKRATSVQYAALPFRRRADAGTEVLLVTSRRTGRWVIPKGWAISREAPHVASAREALEEAGVVGRVDTSPVGSYSYQKRLKRGDLVDCEVHVFPLEVKRQQKNWPEKGKSSPMVLLGRSGGGRSRACFERHYSYIPEATVVACKVGSGRYAPNGA